MKKILIIHHYSQQPPCNTMLHQHNWGKELVERGYEVTIAAASSVHNTGTDMISELGSSTSFSLINRVVIMREHEYEETIIYSKFCR